MESLLDTATDETAKPPSHVLVVDLPFELSASETAQVIEDQSGDFYLLAVLPWPSVGARAFFRRHSMAHRKDKQSSTSRDSTRARFANPDGLDEAAESIIRRCPRMAPAKLAENSLRTGSFGPADGFTNGERLSNAPRLQRRLISPLHRNDLP